MIDPYDRDTGFYWISINGQAAEVAQWHVEWAAWLLAGRTQMLTDEVGAEVQVLSACLKPPSQCDSGPAPANNDH